jgi:tetratricopeptide (TPR) repeat protein
MLEWFKNLSEGWQTAIFGAGVTLALALVGGLFTLFKWFSRKKHGPAPQQKTIHQEGTSHTAAATDGDKNIIAGRDVHTGIDSDAALNTLVKTSRQLGRTKEENTRLKKTIRQLEAQLARPSLEANIALEQSTPAPSAQAKDLANLITEDDGLYARALKAIAQGDNEKADSLLDETQQFLDTVQERKDQAQAKIYIARMQNASYAGRPRDALQYCDKLRTLAANDSLIINEIALVYYENAKYKEAEPLMKRALKIDEASLGKDHPDVATDLNNLGQLYQDTNRLKEAEPLMKRALKIDEASLGKDHPKVAIDLNNLAQLYKKTNRLQEAEPLLQRALKIDEDSFGKDHPEVATDLNNLAQLYQATNRLKEAEPLMQRTLKIDEASFGKDHPNVAIDLNNLAQLYQDTNRLKEAEPLTERTLVIFLQFTRRTGHPHPHLQDAIENYRRLLMQMGHSEDEVAARLKRLAPEMFESTDNQVKEE